MSNSQRMQNMEEVYKTYFPVIYNYVFYKLLNRENTEDVVSQIFEKVLKHLSSFDPTKAAMKTWIMRITDNVLIDFYRRQRANVSYDSEETGLENILHVHFDEQYAKEIAPERQALLRALRELSERERTFLYYKYFLGMTSRDIARRMGMNENTLSAVIARARKKLRVMLTDEI